MENILVKSKIDPLSLFKIGKMKEVIKPTRPHKHADYFELIFLEEGSGTHMIDDVSYPVEIPVAYFLKPNQTHCWDFFSVPRGFVLLFREEIFLHESARDLIYGLPPHIPLKEYGLVKTLMRHLTGFHMEKDVIASHLNILINYLRDCAQEAPSVRSNIVSRYRALVNERFGALKKVADYAAAMNITAHKLNEECKASLGRNAGELIKERIFLEAKTLLIHTRKNINQISIELDFADPSHFSKFFKARAKITPGEFRSLSK